MLDVMNLVVDKFASQNNAKFRVKYKTKNLCDQFFQDNTIIIKNNDQIVLYEET